MLSHGVGFVIAKNNTMLKWKTIAGWEGFYEVSNVGQVRSKDRRIKGRFGLTTYKGRLLKPGYSTGYAMVTLVETGMGRREQFYIHDLVLKMFIGPKPLGLEVCHGPEGPQTNTLTNLRYDTRSANARDRFIFGKPAPRGEQCSSSRLTEADVREIRRLKPSTTARALAIRFGVGHSTILSAAKGIQWAHVL